VPKLIILYGHPDEPPKFEEYYARRHIPYAIEHMRGVIGAENLQVLSTADGGSPPYYRISQLAYDTMSDLRASIGSGDGKAVLADLRNFATGGATILITEP
jgi:uncharacterized protein (TIGR02118 family)